MHIELNEFEQQLSKIMALVRRQNSETLPNMKIGKQDYWESELNGCGAELAAARALNVYPDLRGAGIYLEDLIYGEYTVDVKVTKYPNGKLIAPLIKKNKPCDYYILVVGMIPNYQVVGVASAEMLISDDAIIDLGYGPTYGLNQNQLIPLEEWMC